MSGIAVFAGRLADGFETSLMRSALLALACIMIVVLGHDAANLYERFCCFACSK